MEYYLDTKTNRPVSAQFVKQMIERGEPASRFVKAYSGDGEPKKFPHTCPKCEKW